MYRVARGIQSLTEIAQRLRRVSGSVEQQQRATGRAHQHEALRTLRDPFPVDGEPIGVFPLDGARHMAAVERAGNDGSNWHEQKQRDQAEPLMRPSSVAPH